MIWSLGIDPGKAGAAVLLGPSGKSAVGWAWIARQRDGMTVWQVVIAQWGFEPRVVFVSSIHAIGETIARGARAVAGPDAVILLGCEDQHVAASARSAIILARSAGEIIGPLRAICDPEVPFITPGEWRQVFAIKGGGDVKARSITAVGMWMPEAEGLRTRAARALEVLPKAVEGVVEAYAIAVRRRTWEQRSTRKRSKKSTKRGVPAKRTRTSARSRKAGAT